MVSNGQPRPYIVSTGYCDRNICVMAEGETGSVGVGSTSDSITAFCSDTAHQLFGSSKTRDPFVTSKLLDAQNQGRGNNLKKRKTSILNTYTPEDCFRLKRGLHHIQKGFWIIKF